MVGKEGVMRLPEYRGRVNPKEVEHGEVRGFNLVCQLICRLYYPVLL